MSGKTKIVLATILTTSPGLVGLWDLVSAPRTPLIRLTCNDSNPAVEAYFKGESFPYKDKLFLRKKPDGATDASLAGNKKVIEDWNMSFSRAAELTGKFCAENPPSKNDSQHVRLNSEPGNNL